MDLNRIAAKITYQDVNRSLIQPLPEEHTNPHGHHTTSSQAKMSTLSDRKAPMTTTCHTRSKNSYPLGTSERASPMSKSGRSWSITKGAFARRTVISPILILIEFIIKVLDCFVCLLLLMLLCLLRIGRRSMSLYQRMLL